MTGDKLDVSLVDQALLAELELTIALMVAANGSDRHLTAEEIDELLGVPSRPARGAVPGQRTDSGDTQLVVH